MSYAEFASRIPTAGSAYTYAYASFGELIAWIIGWALIMEYSFGNIYVAFSWSDYFTSFVERLGFGIDDYWMTPKEFFIKGFGDCEDYAIAKYFTLLELGVKKESLYLAVA
jgi:amino acid transporter